MAPQRPAWTSSRFLGQVLAIMFLAEFAVMLLIHQLPATSVFSASLLDAVLLTAVSGGILWWGVLAPLRSEALIEHERAGAVEQRLAVADADRMRTEDLLHTLSEAIEQSPASVIITDPSGAIQYVNPSFTATSGYSADDVLGQNPRMFKSGETPAEWYQALWSTIARGATWRGELRNRKRNGELYWEHATISPVLNRRGEIAHFVATKEDITAQKAAERAALDAERRFQGAQKMEAIGQLAGGIAHDFNNLVTAILGYSDFVLDRVRDNPSLTSDVEEIRKAGERAAQLTRQLLAFSRKQRLEPETVDLSRIVDDIANMVGRVIGENIRFQVVKAESLGYARLDTSQIEQVVMNLVVNARDAMPGGGQVTIATTNADIDDDFVRRHPGAVAGPYVALRVTDTGTGMSPDVLAHAFEPFFTTKPLGKGTGLGLASVFGIVKQSRGYISIESHPGAGTTVAAYFPRHEAPLESAPVVLQEAPRARGRETILLVEDETGLRTLIERVLRRSGYTVLSAPDGGEALSVESNWAGPIDLLLSDIIMPELNGPDMAQRLVFRRPHMKVLFISGFMHHLSTDPGPVGKATTFLQKPFTPQALVQKVHEVLN